MSNDTDKTEKTVTIIVNGRKRVVAKDELTYEEVVNIAFDNNPPTGPNVVITVAYSKAEHDKQGTLVAGESVKVKEGMVFNVKATDRS
jgi:Multiubiquitin